MRTLRVAMVVQGEGRGHMTQALAASRFLSDAGHEVMTVLVGVSPHRSVPKYFSDGMPGRLITFQAPTQVPGRAKQGLSVAATAADAVLRMPAFVKAGFTIRRETEDADVVLNFLDLVAGISRKVLRYDTPCLSVGHNHLFSHPDMDMGDAPGGKSGQGAVSGYAKVTAWGAQARVALSFVPLSDRPDDGLFVSPPLLRPGLDRLQTSHGEFLLAYALNTGYGNALARWQRRHPHVTVRCYLDGGSRAVEEEMGERFHAHELDQAAFLKHLAACRAYVGTAGFESICEAWYLGKPALAVPTEGQLEQELNAWDAQRCGAARWGSLDDLDEFWADPPVPDSEAVGRFRGWVGQASEMLVERVEAAAGVGAGGASSGAGGSGPGGRS